MTEQTRFAARQQYTWRLRDRVLPLGGRTVVMGVVNVTPDSFSDGGQFVCAEAAIGHAMHLLDHGADIVDIGGESTRPNATPVSTEEEMDRVLPVIAGIVRQRPQALVSVDTFKATVARAAVAAGAVIVNDVSGLAWDAAMASACAELQCGVVAMHSRGRPGEWGSLPRLDAGAVVPLVMDGLRASLLVAAEAGVAPDRIVLDPGFGFGKAAEENYHLLAGMGKLAGLGRPLLAGVSRKSFLGNTLAARLGVANGAASERENASVAAMVAAVLAGAHLVRVHGVRAAVEAAAVADALLAAWNVAEAT